MNFERETWRPLFLREPVQRRLWSLVARGLRTYLIQVAEDDGTLLTDCSDPRELAVALSAHAQELDLVKLAIDDLLRDGFLRWDSGGDQPGWLGVDRLVTFPGEPGTDATSAPPPADETAIERRRRLARDRKQRSRDKGRDRPRDIRAVTSVTEERDPRDLPPQSPPSEREINKNSEGARASGDRDRPRDGERDRQRDRPRDVHRVTGEVGTQGHLRIEPQLDHRRFAEQHGLELEEFVARLRRDPRSKRLSTVEAWAVLTRMLERAVGGNESVGGAA